MRRKSCDASGSTRREVLDRRLEQASCGAHLERISLETYQFKNQWGNVVAEFN